MNRGFLSAVALLAVALLFSSCGGVVNNPSPSISSLSPPSAKAGGPGFTLMVNGKGFAPQSAIFLNNIPRQTFFLSGNQLTTMLTPNDIAVAGVFPVMVQTPSPGGGTSNTVNFTVNPASSNVPQITAISPASQAAGGPGFTLTVTGLNFVPLSAVSFNGNNLNTSFVNSTTLQAGVPASSITTAGTAQVQVLNPQPGGGASNPVTFTISNGQPVISMLSPASNVAGATNPLVVAVNGSGFNSASVALFNGSIRPTAFISSAELTMTLTTTDLAAAATFPVQVMNPAPSGGTSAAVPFSVVPSSSGAGLPELLDVSSLGMQANGGLGSTSDSGPVISSDAHFVAFASTASNLVPNDANGVADVFSRSTCLGSSGSCTPTILLASLTSSNTQANAASSQPAMDASGRFVAFTSAASNLVTNVALTGTTRQIFLRDTCAAASACTPSTTLISISSDGTSAANADSFAAAISPDGRYIAFVSSATNLVATPTLGTQEIFLRDTCFGVSSGCTPATTLLTLASDNLSAANGASSQPVLSNHAQFLAFTSAATNLGPNNPGQEVFIRTTCVGATSTCTAGNALASTSDGTTPGNGVSSQPALTSDARFVGFASTATNLGSSSGTQQVYLRDTCNGAPSTCMPSLTLVSVATDGTPGNGLSEKPGVAEASSSSSSGPFVSFASLASNLVATDSNNAEDIFVRNVCLGSPSGCTATTALASVSAPTGSNNMPVQGNGNSLAPALAGQHFVAFISFANNLVANDTNGFEDIFLANTTF